MHSAFLQAIRENPDDDTTRLIYADWLDEQGDKANATRAELIRLQVDLHGDNRPHKVRRKREKQLAELLRQRLPYPSTGSSCPKYIYRKGFLDEIEIRAEHLLELAERIREQESLVRHVHFETAGEDIQLFAAFSIQRRCENLRLIVAKRLSFMATVWFPRQPQTRPVPAEHERRRRTTTAR
jgi:uncharacterized protein (TIGR02996 family)